MSAQLWAMASFLVGSSVTGGIVTLGLYLLGYKIRGFELIRPYALVLALLVLAYMTLQKKFGFGILTVVATPYDFFALGSLVNLAWLLCALATHQIVGRGLSDQQ